MEDACGDCLAASAARLGSLVADADPVPVGMFLCCEEHSACANTLRETVLVTTTSIIQETEAERGALYFYYTAADTSCSCAA